MSTSTTPPRPAVTPSMKLQAAKNIAARNNWEAERADDIAEAFDCHDDGYELAKKLDNDYGWDISAMDVDALDQMDSEVHTLHRAACIEWAKEHDIQPPHPVGTMTPRGEITGIYEHDAAMYLIRRPGEQSSRREIVRFEDVKVEQVVAA